MSLIKFILKIIWKSIPYIPDYLFTTILAKSIIYLTNTSVSLEDQDLMLSLIFGFLLFVGQQRSSQVITLKQKIKELEEKKS